LVVDDKARRPKPLSNFDLEIAVRVHSRPFKNGNTTARFRVFKIPSEHMDAFGTIGRRHDVGRSE